MLGAYLPPEWPKEVPHPASPAFTSRITAWLLDLCPPDFRGEPVLIRNPVVLVRLAHRAVAAQGRGVDLALAGVRAELSSVVSESVIEDTVQALLRERERLVRTRRGVVLVEHVLRGGDFTERL